MDNDSKEDDQTHDKKTQILNATTRLLTVKGLQMLSFEAVANEAGLSRQLVRYYYPHLDALMLDLCDHLMLVYQHSLVSGIVEVRQVERLRFFLDFFFGLAEDHPMPDNLEAYDALFAYAVGSESLRERLRDKYKILGQVIVHELAIAHPELDAAACRELSFVFVSMMHAHWSYVATLGFSPDHNKLARDAIERVIVSYIKSSPKAPTIETPWAHDH
ncbi:TetR/AcrR family transcriptional regulator [Hoeflea poritis]|uniref:TetR/AcrR family transcriptional regulator n=1 Tax=Hoeflea poritis TaxID=2993659 RepID=A0ABT4VIE0_9HYPH|nr:TetR/AcrR family transcriptional regulator [Hoeflea poritis]MDA4843818.1 TetR/AcrR family transcriptional regulator [Hoeflea poritis]